MDSATPSHGDAREGRALRVLLVEDAAADARLARFALAESSLGPFEVMQVETAGAMADELGRRSYDAILLDLQLPDAAGLAALEQARRQMPTVPIVVLTALDDEREALRATRAGAQEYLVKGANTPWTLARTLRHAIERQHIVAELEEARNREHHLATHDALTGLVNRPLFLELVEHESARARRDGRRMAVLFIDLDHFKRVNDAQGHDAGDRLLRELGRRATGCLRASDAAARLGGDEFLALVSDLARGEDAAPVARRILAALAEPVDVGGRSIPITASIGIAVFPDDDRSPDGLVRRADAAMYAAKRRGGNQIVFYTASQHAAAERRAELRSALVDALQRRQLVAHFQPDRDAREDRIVAVEALACWPRSDGDLLLPAAFLDEIDRAALLRPVGDWVLGHAAAEVQRWRGSLAPQLRLRLPVAGPELRSPGFVATLGQALAGAGLPAAAVELELPQGSFAAEIAERRERLEQLRALGVAPWIGGFGAGAGPLLDLRSGLVAGIRIDARLLRGLPDDAHDRALVDALIGIAGSHGLEVAADGVERDEQAAYLAQRGCLRVQGPRIAPPQPAERISALLRSA